MSELTQADRKFYWLQQLREREAATKHSVAILQDKVHKIMEVLPTFVDLAVVQEELVQLKEQIKELGLQSKEDALDVYVETGERNQCDGAIVIQETTKTEIRDEEATLLYTQKHAPALVKLAAVNRSSWKAWLRTQVKADPEGTIALVTVSKEPTAKFMKAGIPAFRARVGPIISAERQAEIDNPPF